MGTMKRWVLVSTGDDEAALDRMESRFELFLAPSGRFQTLRLGRVESLLIAYWNAVRLVDDPEALFLFAHQDVEVALPPGVTFPQPLLDNLGQQAPWLVPALQQPQAWPDLATRLLKQPDTGFLGVAGASSLAPDVAWWNSPDVSGAVMHRDRGGRESFNAYGPYGRVAVLDGLFLMAKGRLFEELGRPRAGGPGFHFYDMEWTLRAHLAGKRNWTLPLLLLHASGGAAVDDELWRQDAARFSERFADYLPVDVPREPLPGWE